MRVHVANTNTYKQYVNPTLMTIAIGALALVFAAIVVYAVTPTNGGTVGGSTIPIDTSEGDQIHPNVSGDLAAYTDMSDSTQVVIRYYDFLNPVTPNASIPRSVDDFDTLSDVNGNHIAFARFNPATGTVCMVYDVASDTTVQIGNASAAGATALGADTVAFVNGSPGNYEIMVGSISNPSGSLTNLSSTGEDDVSPAVSPDGNVVVWASCAPTGCSIMKSTYSGGAWSAASVVRSAPAANADTDGTSIVYEADGDILFQPVGGGAAMQLTIDGVQHNPSISAGVIAFQSAATAGEPWDLFVYQISTNTLFRVTDTPLIHESLNDVTVAPNGDVRMVWAANDDLTGPNANNIYARTFTLNNAPAANAGGNRVVEADSPTGAIVFLSDAGSSDPDPGDTLSYLWAGPFGSASGVSTTQPLPFGDSVVTLTVTDNHGASDTDTITITVGDTTPPVITATRSPEPNGAGWNNSNVTVTFGCTDVADPNPSFGSVPVQTVSSEGAGQFVTIECTDVYGNTATHTVSNINIDNTPPTIALNTPPSSAVYALGQAVPASYSCSDALSDVASCVGTVANGTNINTSTAGTHQFSVNATDVAGNTTQVQHTYSVGGYSFAGFFQPVDNLPAVNLASAGSSIPVRFSLGGNHGLSIFASGYPASSPIACDASEPRTAIEETVTAGGSSLSYDAGTDRYSYIWKTDRSWRGTCRMFVLGLDDGSQHLAKFRFR